MNYDDGYRNGHLDALIGIDPLSYCLDFQPFRVCNGVFRWL